MGAVIIFGLFGLYLWWAMTRKSRQLRKIGADPAVYRKLRKTSWKAAREYKLKCAREYAGLAEADKKAGW